MKNVDWDSISKIFVDKLLESREVSDKHNKSVSAWGALSRVCHAMFSFNHTHSLTKTDVHRC